MVSQSTTVPIILHHEILYALEMDRLMIRDVIQLILVQIYLSKPAHFMPISYLVIRGAPYGRILIPCAGRKAEGMLRVGDFLYPRLIESSLLLVLRHHLERVNTI